MMAKDQQSRVFYELCDLIHSLLCSPPLPISLPGSPLSVAMVSPAPARRPEMSPAGFASLLLGISLALMLCGSVTFVIGFILMPWVLGFVMIFYFVGFVSNLSGIGRSILLGNPFLSATKEMQGQLLSKLPIFNKEWEEWAMLCNFSSGGDALSIHS